MIDGRTKTGKLDTRKAPTGAAAEMRMEGGGGGGGEMIDDYPICLRGKWY